MGKKRKKRRADGTLRPTVARRRARERGVSFADPHVEARFRTLTCRSAVIWNSHDLRQKLALDYVELGKLMMLLAEEHRWAKLRDDNGQVKAIGLPTNHPDRKALKDPEHRAVMVARILRGGLRLDQSPVSEEVA